MARRHKNRLQSNSKGGKSLKLSVESCLWYFDSDSLHNFCYFGCKMETPCDTHGLFMDLAQCESSYPRISYKHNHILIDLKSFSDISKQV